MRILCSKMSFWGMRKHANPFSMNLLLAKLKACRRCSPKGRANTSFSGERKQSTLYACLIFGAIWLLEKGWNRTIDNTIPSEVLLLSHLRKLAVRSRGESSEVCHALVACGLQRLFECVLDTKGEAYWPRRGYTPTSEAYAFGDADALSLAWERNELVQEEWPQNRFSKDAFITHQIETNWSSVLPGCDGSGHPGGENPIGDFVWPSHVHPGVGAAVANWQKECWTKRTPGCMYETVFWPNFRRNFGNFLFRFV